MTTKKMEPETEAGKHKPVKEAPKEKKEAMDVSHTMPKKTKTEHEKEKKKSASHHE